MYVFRFFDGLRRYVSCKFNNLQCERKYETLDNSFEKYS